MRSINLEKLPKSSNQIDWKRSIGFEIEFKYDDIEGILKIVDYKAKGRIGVKYLNYDIYYIKIGSLARCQLKKVLRIITDEFRVQIGTIFKDEKRNLTITNRYKDLYKKIYNYTCNKCGYNGYVDESHLLKRNCGCSCCSGHLIVKGINDFNTTHPELSKYLENIEEGFTFSAKNGRGKISLKCPDCGAIYKIQPYNFVNAGKFNCPKCSDGISYPNKFMFNLLQQLNINFEPENVFKWLKSKRYDFYLPDQNIIIEMNGIQHYIGGRGFPVQLEEQQEIDKFKYTEAINNGITHYIEIDCRKSDVDFIKNNILQSKLNSLFDLSNINWTLCDEFSCNSIMKRVCEYKRDNPEKSTGKIGKLFKLSRTTIKLYLTNGNKIWDWVNYNAEREKLDCIKRKEIKVEVFKDGISCGIFESKVKLQACAVEKFGVKLNKSSVCKSIRINEPHNGYTFKNIL